MTGITAPAALRIGPGLTLPLEVITEATAIVATRGAGKSSTGAVVVEETFKAGVPVVVIDWTGVFWGLRSSAKGDSAGLAIYVLGGAHGDVPLEHTAGKVIADLVVDSGHSFVLDLSDFTKGQMRHFCADFLERLYDRKARARTTLLLVIDEAHELAPQSPRGGFKGDAARLIGAMEQVAALGRSRGLGVVMITQRTQALNKAVLDLIESLIIMRMLSPRAVAAVRDWIIVKNEDDEKGVLPTLKELPTGTAWVWSPLRGILTKVAVRRIRTFDSYKTPEPGQVAIEPKARKELDLGALGERMRATAEQVKANDPANLRAHIGELTRRVQGLEAELASHVCATPAPVRVEVPAIDSATLASLEVTLDKLGGVAGNLAELGTAVSDAVEYARNAREIRVARTSGTAGQGQIASPAGRNLALVPAGKAADNARNTRVNRGRSADQSADGTLANVGQPLPNPGQPVYLKLGARRMLDVLVSLHPLRISRPQLATQAKMKVTGGTFGTYWSTLKRAGLIDTDGDLVFPTDAGFATAGVSPGSGAQTSEQLIDTWRSVLKKGAREMLDYLVSAHPDWVPREELSAATGLEATGGTFGTYLSTLRRNGLVDVNGSSARASDTLFFGTA